VTVRILVVFFVFGILFCLASAAYRLLKAKGSSTNLLRPLAWRVIASVVLFFLILLFYSLGWLNPHPAKFLLKLEAAQQKHNQISRVNKIGC
jgi:hypothetical protein